MKARRIFSTKQIIAILVFIGLGTVGSALAVRHQKNQTRQEISRKYAQIEEAYHQETKQASEKTSDTEQLHVVREPDHTQSMEMLSDFAMQYASQPEGWQAAIRAGTYWITHGRNDKAKEVLTPVVKGANGKKLIRIRVLTALAGLKAAEGNYTEAIRDLEEVASFPENPLPEQAQLLKAQFLFLSGETASPQKILSDILSQDSSNTGSAEIQRQATLWLNHIKSHTK